MIAQRFVLRLMAAVFAATFASVLPVAIALASPVLPSGGGGPCLTGVQVTPTSECRGNLAKAQALWPNAKTAFSGPITGNGDWLVLANDGRHFNEVSIQIMTGGRSPLAPTSASSGSDRTSAVTDVLAQNASGSGQLNLSGWSCGSQPGWSGYAYINTWYVTHLEIDVDGYLNKCNYAVTQHFTPIVTGAGSWTFSDGISGNNTYTTNPWINWYGSNILLCCSVTVLERYYMDAAGKWSWWATA